MKLTQRTCYGIAAALLVVMAVLMFGAARQDSATVDETTALSTGYSYWQGHRFYFVPEHPPLGQMFEAFPLLFMDIKLTEEAQALMDARLSYPWTRPWQGSILPIQDFLPPGCGGHYVDLRQMPYARLVSWECPGATPMQNWYLWALPESQIFGQILIYGGANDGTAMLLTGRCMQILLTLGVGLLIFHWIRRATGNDWAALCGLAVWAFNPNVLAHGHLTTTDMGASFGIAIATFTLARLLEKPTLKAAILWGAATGVAMVMKLTTIILGPVFFVLVLMHWKKLATCGTPVWKLILFAFLAGWAVILAVYFPHWTPAPPIAEVQARALGVPGWFTSLRPLLIPPDFFKALGLTLGHSKEGHEAYLFGEWSQHGWLSYYPLAFFLKNPLAFVLLGIGALVLFVWNFKNVRPMELVPWIAIAVYFPSAMSSSVNIGVRHLLPVFPLLCVGIGCASIRLVSKGQRVVLGLLIGWQCLMALFAYPMYIQFFSEAVGGSANGYKYLLDSNFDWGQDANRLKQFVNGRDIRQIYLWYFGTQYNIEYLKIKNQRVGPEQARQIPQGFLVVSASELMHPEWDWLRKSHQPIERVADTLFVYQLP